MIHYILRSYPDYSSSASYNRVRLMAEGLSKNGAEVKINLLFFKNRKSKYLKILERFVFSYIRHLFQLLRLLKNVNKNDIVIIYDIIDQYWMLRIFGKKTNLVIELTEYPYYETNCEKRNILREKLLTFYNKQYLKCLKYASSVITCSSYLEKYYSRYIEDIFIVPLVVRLDEFVGGKNEKAAKFGDYIAYCGSFINNKDGLPILIDSFKLFHDSFPEVHLVLIGSGPEHVVKKIRKQVDEYGLADAIIFTGSLPHDEVVTLLSGATMLALARPNTRQAEGGVPSKVGEYLASGVPCVITRTGDLPNYLNDGIDCFLCEPDSVQAFAQRLKDCYMADKNKVGENARKAAEQFGNVHQNKRLINYFVSKYGEEFLKSK